MYHQRGFTLLELLIALAIAVILLAIALPSFETWLQRERHTRSVNQLQAMYNFARSEAVKREAKVVLTTSADTLSVLTASDELLLRQFHLSPQLIYQLSDIELQATGQVPMAAQWQVRDPRGLVADRCLTILPSGQLTVLAASCTT
ncbi:MAG: GspH/FimT family pseudopilin [Alkalimonas sp.]|nr:GspH/FimT family pseudopilin [Alkalimonas sp.]